MGGYRSGSRLAGSGVVLVRHERLLGEHLLGSLLVLVGVMAAIVSDRRRVRQARPDSP